MWRAVRDATWRAQVLGPGWETVARAHITRLPGFDASDAVGATTISDRANRASHEVDIVAMRGSSISGIGEAKLRKLDVRDVARLRQVRERLRARDAKLVLVSAEGVDEAARQDPDVIVITPGDVYG